MSKKIKLLFSDTNFKKREFKIKSFEELDNFPEDSYTIKFFLPILIFSKKDIMNFRDDTNKETISNDDFRIVLRNNLEGTYIEISDICFTYLKENVSDIYVFDPCMELEDEYIKENNK